mmetsp:Transcript_43415/g.120116  ORF Transcript_43415/g.120116 Transcript_43415/m.120116 type:complete len:223 (-) Transcript_43415:2462-3130(-)
MVPSHAPGSAANGPDASPLGFCTSIPSAWGEKENMGRYVGLIGAASVSPAIHSSCALGAAAHADAAVAGGHCEGRSTKAMAPTTSRPHGADCLDFGGGDGEGGGASSEGRLGRGEPPRRTAGEAWRSPCRTTAPASRVASVAWRSPAPLRKRESEATVDHADACSCERPDLHGFGDRVALRRSPLKLPKASGCVDCSVAKTCARAGVGISTRGGGCFVLGGE